MGEGTGRPQVRVVGPAGAPAPPPARRPWRVVALGLVVLAALLWYAHQRRTGWSVSSARLRDDGTLSVVLVNRGDPLRVTDVRLRAQSLTAVGPAALRDEVDAAQAHGVPTAHDPARLLGRGTSTFVLPVRARCPRSSGPDPSAAVLVEAAGRTAVSELPTDVADRLGCPPLSLRAGLSPVPPAEGHVELLVTAYADGLGRPRDLQGLRWPGYRVLGVGNVVPALLDGAGIDETIYFDADVAPQCPVPQSGQLTAVFADGTLPVPLTPVAAAHVAALRAPCS